MEDREEMENVVSLDLQDPKENLDFKVWMVYREIKVIGATKDPKARKEIGARTEWWEMMDHLGYQVFQEKWAQEGFQVLEDLQVSR